MRYFFNLGAQFAEPVSIFFSIQLTFYGAAACFRANAHLRLQLFVNMLSEEKKRIAAYIADALMACVAVFMMVWGASLVETTFFQTYPEFQYVRVGLVYTAIPLGGLVLLLFVIEAAFFGSGGQTSLAKLTKEAEELVREARSSAVR